MTDLEQGQDAWVEARRSGIGGYTDTPSCPVLDLGQAVLVHWTADEYHSSIDTTSRSELETLRERPQFYYQRHEVRSIPPDPPSTAMILGTHVHTCVLEPDVWQRRLYAPEPHRPPEAKGTAKRDSLEYKAYVAWKAEIEGWAQGKKADSIVLNDDQRRKIEAMATSVRGHPYLRELLDGDGFNEQTVIWRHAETGIYLRLRVDRLRHFDDETKVVLDLKTTADPDPRRFSASCARYGYHRQGAIYTDAVQALYPGAEVHYALAVVCSSPPYETAVYELDDALELGRKQYNATLRDLARRRQENDWIASWQRGCRTLNMPAWAYMENDDDGCEE